MVGVSIINVCLGFFFSFHGSLLGKILKTNSELLVSKCDDGDCDNDDDDKFYFNLKDF